VKQVMMTVGLMALMGLVACSPQSATQSSVNAPDADTSGIIGGEAVTSSDPIDHSTVQLISLIAQKDPKTGKIGIGGAAFCTATLIAEDVVVSAGHCTVYNPQLIFVYFSDKVPQDIGALFNSFPNNPLLRQAAGGMTSPQWPNLTENTETDWGDISLVKFAGGLAPGYVTAKMIPANAKLNTGDTVTLAGYGYTNGSPVVKATELRKVDVTIKDANYAKTELMIDTAEGKGSCHGDSGGPAYIKIGGVQYLTGLTSRADHSTDPEGKCIGLTVYTNVQAYLSWIAQSVRTLEAADYKLQPIPQPNGM
jgi:V8-like Glu-specific endopeptidase